MFVKKKEREMKNLEEKRRRLTKFGHRKPKHNILGTNESAAFTYLVRCDQREYSVDVAAKYI
jgi:hypothetical protein